MAVALDSYALLDASAAASGSTPTWSFADSNTVLVGSMSWYGAVTYSAMKVDNVSGASLTQHGSTFNFDTTGNIAFAHKAAPGSGTHGIYGAVSGTATGLLIQGSTWTGVDQTTPLAGSGPTTGSGPDGDSPGISVSSATGNKVVDCHLRLNEAITPTQTLLQEDEALGGSYASGSSYANGAASVTMNWNITYDPWGSAGVSIVQTSGAAPSEGAATLSSPSASLSGSGTIIGYPAYGYATPDAGEIATSWTTWHLGAGASVSGDADYGDLVIPPTVTCDSPVVNMGDANNKTITLSTKYGSNTGTVTRYIRGSDSLFAWDDGTPSWSEYTGAVSQAWQYVQARLVGA